MRKLRIGGRLFPLGGHTYTMGILNVTPDSFSDGGRYVTPERALFRVEEMLSEGADLIDVGGESTRPGHTPVAAGEEIARVLPVIRAIKARFDVPISLDTCKAATARAGLEAGADLVNDVWGLRRDPEMAAAIAAADAAVVVMHNRAAPVYGDFMADVREDLRISVEIARAAGVAADRIILDPGVGFAKSPEQNLTVIHRISELKALGLPLLLGVSRKSVIGYALDLPVTERGEGTLAAGVYAALQGVDFVRVHDVRASVRAIRMTEAILRERKAGAAGAGGEA